MFQLETLQTTYRLRFESQQQRRTQVWDVLTANFFQKFININDAVLDIGAGFCEFANAVRCRQVIALDLNPQTKAMANPNVNVITQSVTEPWPLETESIDIAFSSNFLEHLPDKQSVCFCLSEARRILKPGGKLLLLGPNIRFCPDIYWDFFDHLVPLSDRSMMEALRLKDFEVAVSIPRFLPYTMSGAMPAHPLLVKIYLRLPWAWHIFGAQFFLVGKKPD
jgi:SAM-dependent methyltransferase